MEHEYLFPIGALRFQYFSFGSDRFDPRSNKLTRSHDLVSNWKSASSSVEINISKPIENKSEILNLVKKAGEMVFNIFIQDAQGPILIGQGVRGWSPNQKTKLRQEKNLRKRLNYFREQNNRSLITESFKLFDPGYISFLGASDYYFNPTQRKKYPIPPEELDIVCGIFAHNTICESVRNRSTDLNNLKFINKFEHERIG